ncbi:helix-turn-helix domain-containing protein, partial [Escherichia coli]|nr:helix-turn-helix domain-containing protein [Escherichia coli]
RLRAVADGNRQEILLEIPAALEEVEKMMISATLDYCEGDKSRAARLLNISRKTLYRKMAEYGIEDAAAG